MTEFYGISERPGRGIIQDAGLYEFWTDSDVPVRLHDATFLGLDYRLSMEPALAMLFIYDDPEWTPTKAAATPVIRFSFTGVTDLHADGDPGPGASHRFRPGKWHSSTTSSPNDSTCMSRRCEFSSPLASCT